MTALRSAPRVTTRIKSRFPTRLVSDDQMLEAWGRCAEHDAEVIAGLVELHITAVRVRLELLHLGYLDPQKPTSAAANQRHRRLMGIAKAYRRGDSTRTIARRLRSKTPPTLDTVKCLGLKAPMQAATLQLPILPSFCQAPPPPPTELTDNQIRAACQAHDDLRSAALALQVIPSVLRRRVNAQKAVRPKLREDYEHWDIDRPILKLWTAGTNLDQMAKQLKLSKVMVARIVKQLRLPERE